MYILWPFMLQGITVTYLDYRMCSLLYCWNNTIAQVMYVYCSDTTCRYHFCTLWRCNANGESTLWLFWYKYYEYIRMIIFDVEVDKYFCTVTGLFWQCRCFFYKAQVDKCWWGLKCVVGQWAVYLESNFPTNSSTTSL